MTERFDLYGCDLGSLDEAKAVLEQLLRCRFAEHDSGYLGGAYLLAKDLPEKIQVIANVPDDEGYYPERGHEQWAYLVRVSTSRRWEELDRAIAGSDVLTHLRTKTSVPATTGPLFDDRWLPAGFTYPESFVRAAERGLSDLPPWRILTDQPLQATRRRLSISSPEASYVPFAARDDADEIACWQPGRGEEAVIVRHRTGRRDQVREILPDFAAWLRHAGGDTADVE